MRLIRLTKKIGKSRILGDNPELDINWASGPGFRNGPEDYFCVKVEADNHDFAIEFNVDESRRLKEQVDKFLQFIDDGKQMWEPGNYFKNLKKKKRHKNI
jgi:hypothetical protein